MKSFNGTSQVNTFVKGMNMDLDKSIIQKDTYTYAENIRLVVDSDGTYGALQGIEGMTKYLMENNTLFFGLHTDSEEDSRKAFGIMSEKIIATTNVRDVGCVITEHDNVNSIYRIDFVDDTMRVTWVTTQSFNFGYQDNDSTSSFNYLSLVSRWENSDNIKVYITDGYHSLRYVNLSTTKLDENRNADLDHFSYNPSATLTQPIFDRFIPGRLNSGLIQYAYQLFTINGARSNISPLSSLIHLTTSNTRDVVFKGTAKGENTGKGIQLHLDIEDTKFDRVRVFSIRYDDNYSVPVISIVVEQNINSVTTILDIGNVIAEYTVDEFLAEYNYEFIARVIESKDNLLFAANIIEDTWVLPDNTSNDWYDTRSYSFRRLGPPNDPTWNITSVSNILTQDGTITTLNNTNLSTVPFDHDCINPINQDVLTSTNQFTATGIQSNKFVYQYNSDVNAMPNWGGTGVNVDYKIVHTVLGEDCIRNGDLLFGSSENVTSITNPENKIDQYNYGQSLVDVGVLNTFGAVTYNTRKKLPIYNSLYSNVYTFPLNEWQFPTKSISYLPDNVNAQTLNYTNEYIDARFRGYQRDSIYRLGVVFRNKKGQTTPVSWIADIRMPSMGEAEHRLFDVNVHIPLENVTSGTVRGKWFSVGTYPIGLEFTFKNISLLTNHDVVAIEIVRAERSIDDRSIITQGIVSKTIHGGTQGNVTYNNVFPFWIPSCGRYADDVVIRPSSALTIWEDVSQYNYHIKGSTTNYDTTKLFNFTSPDINVSRNDFQSYLSGRLYIEPMYGLISNMRRNFSIDTITPYTDSHSVTILAGRSNGNGGTDWGNVGYTTGMSYTRGYNMLLLQHSPGSTITTPSTPVTAGVSAKYFVPYTEALIDTLSSISGSVTCELRDIVYNNDLNNVTDHPFGSTGFSQSQSMNGWSYSNWVIRGGGLYATAMDGGPHGPSTVFSLNSNSDYSANVIPFIKMCGEGITAVGTLFNGTTITSPGTATTKYTTYFGRGTVAHIEQHLLDMLSLGTTYLCNLKKNVIPYGGLTYEARKSTQYLTTGFIEDITDNTSNHTFYVFGGDTYIGIHNYVHAHSGYAQGNAGLLGPNDIDFLNTIACYYPCESSINLSLAHGTQWQDFGNFDKVMTESGLTPFRSIYTTYTQTDAFYGYNTAYSANSTVKPYFSLGTYDKSRNAVDYRIHYSSQQKTNEEVLDSWLNFRPFDYLDLDSRYGSINNLKVFKNNLFAWQDSAFGVLSVNTRSLIQDNNASMLQLGKGDVLDRIDYLTLHNGSKKNAINGVGVTPSLMFWYDHDRAEIVSYYGQTDTSSKIYGVQSHLNKYKLDVIDNVIATYDQKYNNAHIVLDQSKNGLISYDHLLLNEQIKGFTSFLTYKPKWFINTDDIIVSIEEKLSTSSNAFYRHNSNSTNLFFDNIPSSSHIEFIANDTFASTKVFDNVKFYAENIDNATVLNAAYETTTQLSNMVTKEQIWDGKREDTYRISIPREVSTNIGRMRGKWLKEIYNIQPTDNNFNIPYVETIYRISDI